MNRFDMNVFIGYFVSILTFSFYGWVSFKFYGLIIGLIIGFVIGFMIPELIFRFLQKSEVKE